MQRAALILALAAWCAAAAAYDANGVALGASEAEVAKRFPNARCKPLEWKSDAADRRCDDARIVLGGVPARITFYLRRDAVQAFDVRFDTKEVPRVTAFLKGRYGKPKAESREAVERKPGETREIYKVQWEQGNDRAELVSRAERNRAELSVTRGDFEQQIYRIK